MAAGGAIATLSGGAGLGAWPVFLLGLGLLGFRRPAQYGAWLGVALLASLPYIIYMVLQPGPASHRVVSVMNPRHLLHALGWPLAQGITSDFVENAMAFRHGLAGLVLAAIGLALLLRRERALAVRAAPAVMVLAYGLLTVWQTSLFRSMIAPWYTGPFMTFWVRLLGLAAVLGTTRDQSRTWQARASRGWAVVVVCVLVVAYASSNLTYHDKAFYLFSRAPASASCLRHYRIAPTSCEDRIFQWGVGHPELIGLLAAPLERHHLNVFSPRQRWTLQGDFALDTVRVHE